MEPKPDPDDKRISLNVSNTLLALVEQWRFGHRAASRNDAIRYLIKRGLEADAQSERTTK